jgi:hypothetical protein
MSQCKLVFVGMAYALENWGIQLGIAIAIHLHTNYQIDSVSSANSIPYRLAASFMSATKYRNVGLSVPTRSTWQGLVNTGTLSSLQLSQRCA